MQLASELPAGVAFGRFRLLPHRRELFSDDRPIKLGGRAFDVLLALIETRGAVITKDALMARVWPRSTGRAGKVPCPGNCGRQKASLGCGTIRAVLPRPRRFFSRSMIGSPKASTRQT
jgi:hypothetical protein